MGIDFERLVLRMSHTHEDYVLYIIERYERGEQPPEDEQVVAAGIIELYQKGCGCLYCGKSAIPDRSPERDICTPADCARGLAEYLRRMED